LGCEKYPVGASSQEEKQKKLEELDSRDIT